MCPWRQVALFSAQLFPFLSIKFAASTISAALGFFCSRKQCIYTRLLTDLGCRKHYALTKTRLLCRRLPEQSLWLSHHRQALQCAGQEPSADICFSG
ncbi:hypothetical protein C8J57DRAFT_1283043 [Mycena rebaudengoi]|nr:hypothetical protein C8J57DRAFT_1283043 [Mycena rebaudengoi]